VSWLDGNRPESSPAKCAPPGEVQQAAPSCSLRQAAAEYGLNFRTVQMILAQPEPPPFRRRASRAKPVLGPFLPLIHQILDDDRLAPPKQRHTARRIYERLRDEHDYTGCPSIVRAAVAADRQSQAEVFVPLLHPPGQAQVDFGRAFVVVAGIRHQAALFVLTLPHSNTRFACLFPREYTETFHEGHARPFAFFGGVPTRISYDNSKLAVAKLTGPHERRLTTDFLRLQAHFAFGCFFCRVRQAHEKGHVENGVGYVRRNFLVPVPQADSWAELNAQLANACRREFGRPAADRSHTTAELLAADRSAFLPLPAEPFEAHRVELVTVNSLSLARFDGNDYSVPTAFAYQALTATGTIDRVRFSRGGTMVAEHRRCWAKGQVTFEPLHYLALLERKPGAFDHAKPLAGWSLPAAFGQLRRRLEEGDPKRGTRQYIRVLRLLETHPLAAVTAAVERALRLAVADADCVCACSHEGQACAGDRRRLAATPPGGVALADRQGGVRAGGAGMCDGKYRPPRLLAAAV
jgi:transposase